jgi:hypothetical protein
MAASSSITTTFFNILDSPSSAATCRVYLHWGMGISQANVTVPGNVSFVIKTEIGRKNGALTLFPS